MHKTRHINKQIDMKKNPREIIDLTSEDDDNAVFESPNKKTKPEPIDNDALVHVTPKYVFFWKPPGWPSQWYPSDFYVRGNRYSCAEQYMMAEKAKLFNDVSSWKKIMAESDPAKMKALGRKVSNFKLARWITEGPKIVYRANLAKFTQNVELREKLLATGQREMVEASWRDKIWGIGLSVKRHAKFIENKEKWRGKNCLGLELDRVREHIRQNKFDDSDPEVAALLPPNYNVKLN